MLLLTTAASRIRLVTSGTSAVDFSGSFTDLSVSSVTPGIPANVSITTATTTDVVNGPGVSTTRRIQRMSARNRGAGTQVVTVLHFDGTLAAEVFEAVLAPDFTLMYHEAAGFWIVDSQGRAVVQNVANAGVPITDSDTIVRLTADVTNNNATANTIQDVTGLSFPVTAAKLYWFEFRIVYTAAATTTGSRWSISGPAAPTYLDYTSEYSLTATTTTRNALIQVYDSPAASNASSATTGNNMAWLVGVIQPSAGGTVTARFASEIASSAIVAKAESFVRYRQITP